MVDAIEEAKVRWRMFEQAAVMSTRRNEKRRAVSKAKQSQRAGASCLQENEVGNFAPSMDCYLEIACGLPL